MPNMRQTVKAGSRSKNGETLDPVLQFLRQMWSVDHAMQKMSKHMAATIGLTGPQRLAMRMISRSPGMAAGELAALLHLDPSTITGILGRLERGRWISRNTDPADGRRTRLYLTASGRAHCRLHTGTAEAAARRALASSSRGDVRAAERVLSRLASELDGEVKKVS